MKQKPYKRSRTCAILWLILSFFLISDEVSCLLLPAYAREEVVRPVRIPVDLEVLDSDDSDEPSDRSTAGPSTDRIAAPIADDSNTQMSDPDRSVRAVIKMQLLDCTNQPVDASLLQSSRLPEQLILQAGEAQTLNLMLPEGEWHILLQASCDPQTGKILDPADRQVEVQVFEDRESVICVYGLENGMLNSGKTDTHFKIRRDFSKKAEGHSDSKGKSGRTGEVSGSDSPKVNENPASPNPPAFPDLPDPSSISSTSSQSSASRQDSPVSSTYHQDFQNPYAEGDDQKAAVQVQTARQAHRNFYLCFMAVSGFLSGILLIDRVLKKQRTGR